GDHRWILGASTIGSFSQFDLYRLDLSRRVNLAYHAFQFRDFFFFPVGITAGGVILVDRITESIAGGEAIFQYPFSSRYRLEAGVGFTDRSIPTVVARDDGFGQLVRAFDTIDFSSVDASLFFVGDTSRWQPYGPFHGWRYRVGGSYSGEVGGDGGVLARYQVDFRKYWKISRRSSFAYRLFGLSSNTRDTELNETFSIGGLNTIRGYDFRSIVGDRVFFQNFELRFPLVDRLQLPFGAFTDIRGVIFADVGGGYFAGGAHVDPITQVASFRDPSTGKFVDSFGNPASKFDCFDSVENDFKDCLATVGVGFNFRLGFLELNWVFAQRIDANDDGRWHSFFYIGNKF
ncbi:MAG: BamA/TamA family outer membrane protein, partial [Acidobacteriota bacterium]